MYFPYVLQKISKNQIHFFPRWFFFPLQAKFFRRKDTYEKENLFVLTDK